MPAKYVRAYSKGQKNDFRDAEAIAEAVQRPTRLRRRDRAEGFADMRNLDSGVSVSALNTRHSSDSKYCDHFRYQYLCGGT